jgi:two-component system OmpR family sensor kinase
MNGAKDMSDSDLQLFAAAIAHEIRTPLTAVAGEIEVALRCDRSADEYREVLQRIAAPVSELVAISGDLAVLSDPADCSGAVAASAPLDAILARIRSRYVNNRAVRMNVDGAVAVRVAGDEQRLARAITLVIEHAIRHRRPNASVSVRVAMTRDNGVRIVIDAEPSGFWPHAWSALKQDATPGDPLRLRNARRILEGTGGALKPGADSETKADVVHIYLNTCG